MWLVLLIKNDSIAVFGRSVSLNAIHFLFHNFISESNESAFIKFEYKLKSGSKIEDFAHIFGINKYNDDKIVLCLENRSLS